MSSNDMIRNFIVSTIIDDSNGSNNLKDTDTLLESGILDSLGIMKLLSFLEEKFSVSLESGELMPENFETVKSIASLIESKMA